MRASTAASSPAPCPALPRPRRRPEHHPGALGAAWSTWSTTDFHRKSTIRGEVDSWVWAAARKCLLITRKIFIPPPDSWDPPDGPVYFAKKNVPRAISPDPPQGSVSGQKKIRPPDCWDPPATSSHARKCVRAKKMIRPLTARTYQLHLRTQGSA